LLVVSLAVFAQPMERGGDTPTLWVILPALARQGAHSPQSWV
jgi:hypothetical protein